jgi:CMP-N-acetylneuraminic acid synthetase
MNNTEIGVWSCSRTSSTRCKRKMVRPFAETTLTDIFLTKLAKLKRNVLFGGYEDIFREKCQEHGVPFVQRTEKAATVDEPASKIYEFLNDQPYEYLLQVNACIPFLKTESIVKFLEICVKDDKPKFAVFKKNNYYTSLEGKPYNFSGDLSTINTKNVSPVNEFAHVFYYFKKSHFVETGWYWNWNELEYIEIDEGLETFDIDTEEQFQMAEGMWKSLGYPID